MQSFLHFSMAKDVISICNNTKENLLRGPCRENKCQILQNDILHMKFSEFYLCFHNSCEIWHLFSRAPMRISIYTLSDLGDLSNLIGSLSRTIQQYSPPSEWIMCELGVFSLFLENDLLKVEKILGLTFLRQGKTSKHSIRRLPNYRSWVLCSMIVYNSGLFA